MDKREIFLDIEKQIKDAMIGDNNNYKAQQFLIEYTTLSQREVTSIIDGWNGELPSWIVDHVRDVSFVKRIKTDDEKFDVNKFNVQKSQGMVIYDARRAKYVGDVNKKAPARIRVISEGTIDREYLIKKQKEIKEENRRQELELASQKIYSPKMRYETRKVESQEAILGSEILIKNKLMKEHRDLINKFWEEDNE